MTEIRKAVGAKLSSKRLLPSFGGLLDRVGIVSEGGTDLLEHLAPLFNEIHHRDCAIRILLHIGLLECENGFLRRSKSGGIGPGGGGDQKQPDTKSQQHAMASAECGVLRRNRRA